MDSAGTVFSFEQRGSRLLVATVVDDSIVAYLGEALLKLFCDFLESKLPIQVAPVEYVCGMRIRKQADGSYTVDQTEYITKKAIRYECDGVKMRRHSTPMDSNFEIESPRPTEVDTQLVSVARELVGSLIYATITRHDCKFACSKLSSVVTNPTRNDIRAMKRVLRYLYITRDTTLTFRPGSWVGPNGVEHAPLQLCVFVDASFAKESGRHSQTGFALMLGGASVHSKSGKQTQVTDSTGYAETIALHEAANWAQVAARHLNLMFAPQPNPVVLYEDNSAAETFFAKGPGPRSLHWDVKLYYIHGLRDQKIIDVKHIDTKLQIADVLTKPLPEADHLRLSAYLLGGPVVFDV